MYTEVKIAWKSFGKSSEKKEIINKKHPELYEKWGKVWR